MSFLQRAVGILGRTGVVLTAAVLIFPSLVWVCLDRSVFQWDQAHYGENSVELFYQLLHDPWHWPAAVLAAVFTKAPGIAWFGQWFVPLRHMVGSVDLALHLSTLVPQLITLVFVFRTGRELCGDGSRLVPFAGCVLVASAPLFVAMSHQYLVEAPQGMAVAWVFWIAIRGRHWSRPHLLAQLCGAAAVAMLAKQTSPLYCLLPGVMGIVWLFVPRRDRPPGTRRSIVGLVVAVALLGLTAAWYVQNLPHVYRHSYQSAVGEVSLHYGSKTSLPVKALFWGTAIGNGLFTPALFFGTLAVTAVAVVVRWRARPTRPPGAGDWLALFALLHVLAVFAALCLGVNEDTRYLLPCLPALAVVLMWALAQVPRPAVAGGFLLLASAQWVVVFAVAFGLLENRFDRWLVKVDRDPTAADELTRLVDLTGGENSPADRPAMVGVELPRLNFNSLNYYAAKRQLDTHRRVYFVSPGYAEADLKKALIRVITSRALYFISLEPSRQPQPPDFLNLLSLPMLDKVQQSAHFRRVPFESELGIVVWKLVGE
jgi:hypothetical protein